jgi:protoheme IX farnesyltransferase
MFSRVKALYSIVNIKIIYLLDLAALGGMFLALNKISYSLITQAIGLIIGGSLASYGSLLVNKGYEVEKDRLMTRTKHRIEYEDYIGRRKIILLGLSLLALGTLVTALIVSPISSFFVFLGGFTYIVIYTIWLKPRTPLNIVIGGLAGSAASWAGFSAVTNPFNLANLFPFLILGVLVFCWTPGHFWALALRYKEDYKRAGFPMLPVIRDERESARMIVLSNVIMIASALALGIYLGLEYLIPVSAISSLLIYYNLKLYFNPTKEESWVNFKFSSPYLAFILLIIIIIKILTLI